MLVAAEIGWCAGPAFQLMASILKTQPVTPGTRAVWNAHCGTRAQERHLRQRAKKCFNEKGEAASEVRSRLYGLTMGEVNVEFSRLFLMGAAINAAEETGESWITCLNVMLDKYVSLSVNTTGGKKLWQR